MNPVEILQSLEELTTTFWQPPPCALATARFACAAAISSTRVPSRRLFRKATIVSLVSADAEDRQGVAFTRRLDLMSRPLQRLEGDALTLTNITALFIRLGMTTTEPNAPEYLAETKAKNNQHFDGFTIILAKRLQQRRHFKNEIPEDIT